jgi:hypothetical protein
MLSEEALTEQITGAVIEVHRDILFSFPPLLRAFRVSVVRL